MKIGQENSERAVFPFNPVKMAVLRKAQIKDSKKNDWLAWPERVPG
ncbi:hypothetical protein PX56_001022 [Salmonella enterica subsp. enterica]|uniref:Uncharacterized protein n=1 Tax=Salmonella enterica subsp. enterica serovar Java TaxID=224729 RepID=A0A732RC83_SALEB|nr:hypothetical protein [Salmonella enterica subsp. enterica]EGM4116468.1 hypothetical protein [Salmonella enterica]EJC2555395.1 hypothetical protein [Salmonella enterica]HAE5276083.1 hypothetical protein [Salmonella enterica subsp. enterica serovar Java]HEC7363473.1 hypothetical protein [Salmonella enterica subsp. enterica serovar Stanley]